jgi:hypothetical protein
MIDELRHDEEVKDGGWKDNSAGFYRDKQNDGAKGRCRRLAL